MWTSLKQYVLRLIRRALNISFSKDKDLLTFIPHAGCEIDGSNFINYKSDSALTFFHYIAIKYGKKYKYQIAAGDDKKNELQDKVSRYYPELKVRIISHPALSHSRFSPSIALSKSYYIFSSQAIPFDYISNKRQEVYFLGYYALNLKNDINDQYIANHKWYNRAYTCFFSPSLLFSQINSLVYNVPISKFYIAGLARNDNINKFCECPKLNNWIITSVEYDVKKIFLYTPTHRDYEESVSVVRRGIMGFEFNKDEIELFLKDINAVIIVKIHSRQNVEALRRDLPNGVLLHESSEDYGLNELLQKADFLISDYTSAYYDYLLLDRPVLFNFYDFDMYRNTRGFSFDPIEPIFAGEVFVDQKSMIEKMSLVLNEDNYKEKRHFVRDLIFKYKDMRASERVYNHVFN